MNASPRTLLAASLALSSVLAAGCSSDDDSSTPAPTDDTVTGQLTALGLTELAGLITAAGLDTTLQGTGPFTVFAPSNAAIQALDAAEVMTLTDPANVAQLEAFLQYHVINGQDLDAAAVTSMSSYTMLDGNDIVVDTVNSNVFINNAMVATADQAASNGTIHIINRVLRAPTETATASLATDGFAITAGFIADASLEAAVNAAGTTLIAPTDAAWNALPAPNDLAFYQNAANVADLSTLLQRHVYTAGEVPASAAVAAGDVASAEGGLLFFANDAGPVTVNGVQVDSPNRPTTGALIHGVGSVLVDPGTIVDVATADGNFGTLLAEATDAGLAATLAGAGPFTLFAPTDAAITAWVTANGNTDIFSNAARQAEATDVLEFHVINGDAIQEGELRTLSSVTTIEGTVFVSVNGSNQVELTDAMGNTAQATITATNVYGNQGVIHVIDSVLVPTTITP